jgi:predicted DCC family thiol-disulfide oxidoreductase YuxK
MNYELNKKIIFFDGDCGLCNRFIQFILKNEKSSNLFFSHLLSNFSSDFFLEKINKLPELTTFYFWDGKKLYSKSNGIFKLIYELKFYWKFALIFKLIPNFIRDKIYDYVAKNRSKISSKYCLSESKLNQKRFL